MNEIFVADSSFYIGMDLEEFKKQIDTLTLFKEEQGKFNLYYYYEICIDPCPIKKNKRFDNFYFCFLFLNNKLVRLNYSLLAVTDSNNLPLFLPYSYKNIYPKKIKNLNFY